MSRSPFTFGDIPNPKKWKERWPKSQSHNPTDHDRRRRARMENVDGRFINCRNFVSESECRKRGRREDCKDCRACPQCGGQMFFDVFRHLKGVIVYQVEDKVCLQCGARIHGKAAPVEMPRKKERSDFPPFCSVPGCRRRTWDGYDLEGLPICLQHAERQERWKGDGPSPLIVSGGVVIENPEIVSRSKHGKRTAGSKGGSAKPKGEQP